MSSAPHTSPRLRRHFYRDRSSVSLPFGRKSVCLYTELLPAGIPGWSMTYEGWLEIGVDLALAGCLVHETAEGAGIAMRSEQAAQSSAQPSDVASKPASGGETISDLFARHGVTVDSVSDAWLAWPAYSECGRRCGAVLAAAEAFRLALPDFDEMRPNINGAAFLQCRIICNG